MARIKFKYVGKEFLHGIPARDLSVEDWNSLNNTQRQAVQNSSLYEAVTAKKRTAQKDGDE